MAKVILVDDHQLVREGLRTLLEKDLGMEVVGEAGDGETAVKLVREFKPDVVIMDVSIPGIDGIEATKQITAENPSVKVIALSMYSNKLYVTDMFDAGASGYLLKECASMELATAIDSVLTSEVYLSPKVAGIVLESQLKSPQDTRAGLTERECEIIRLLASGKSLFYLYRYS